MVTAAQIGALFKPGLPRFLTEPFIKLPFLFTAEEDPIQCSIQSHYAPGLLSVSSSNYTSGQHGELAQTEASTSEQSGGSRSSVVQKSNAVRAWTLTHLMEVTYFLETS